MDYRIEELEALTVVGQAIPLTQSQKHNLQLSQRFWKQFNQTIKKEHLSQSGNWVKYAFMIRKNHQLFYYCALPFQNRVPNSFFTKNIKKQKYLVFEHRGDMNKIYQTYGKIYQDILPQTSYIINKDDFLHFEKYDHRFYWNHPDSIIEIWIPLQ